MKLTNNEIYNYAIALSKAFADNTQRFPMKVNFYLQKNKKILTELGQDLEESRMDIIQTYGKTEDGIQYEIPRENIEIAQKELEELLSLEQDVNIYMISADSLTNDISLTTEQMEAMLFMIE